MPGVRLVDLLNETATATVRVGDAEITLRYRVLWDRGIGEEEWEQLQQLSPREYHLQMLPRLIESWDLLDGQDVPIPVTAADLDAHDLPTRFLQMCHQAVMEAMVAGKGNASSSRAG